MSHVHITRFTPNIGPPPEVTSPLPFTGDDLAGKRILLRVPNWLGDAVMALPAIHQFRKRLPDDAQIAILTREKLSSFWSLFPWIDNVFAQSGKRLDTQLRHVIRRWSPDLTFILPNSFGSAWDCFKARFPTRIGRSGYGRSSLLHHTIPPLPPSE
ncbi:MAG: hypothetical protein D6820_01285, partial [Lentisphaerae bacterium]